MEKINESNLEKQYYTALKNIEINLNNYSRILSKNIMEGESGMQIQERSELKSRCLDGIVNHYLKAVGMGNRLNNFNATDQVFFQFRNFFQNISLQPENKAEIEKDIQEILRRVGTDQKLDFSQINWEKKDGVTYVDFKSKQRI
jgi:hypothetical protein